ncbi:biotin carboxyl carrier protein of acetyl-CoA carboxylase [Variibacter gotjawalensis]|uniref:Biotin carboxyl carrier protein of acetyl-CoA carboxylase n=1 Tax=Variibacter gotjawalensis TaxID=1333996 RepID=A0A0S3PY62_9BRAD|nr:acetyl-CoA carboxylase biotin carboxyl carrier protein [Variibacter gotjawalensis]NIK46716.1 acetyl-CoA carboxylase biotin carboxyl carrier protein [Variibacter gotjawalensis]RZS48619.1 acetyl-CoA carboxylase biotin carboxyl carrier protein [Variibacter gotjawalensis]BAT60881.1 biotin carboxyl carrier protein of acetyl-CoA carboxylase [Variibacter gotjawalensis]
MAEAKKTIDQELIRDLATLLSDTGLTEIEVEQSGLRVRVVRQPAVTHVAAPMPVAIPSAIGAGAAVAASAGNDAATHPGAVLSPMVGTAYRASEPGGMPFADIGRKVKAGETILIIEAMKTMNQIPAPRAGTVVQIFVEDGQPVEFGEALMVIE